MNIHRLFTAILVGGLLLLANGGMTPAQALLAQHDCSFCHDFHGAISNAGLLKASSSETLCLSCHNVAINDTAAAAIHNPLSKVSNASGYITCRECHNPHDNVGGNVKLLGYKYDPQTGQRFVNPTIRVETTVGPPPYPTYKTVTFTGSADFNKGNGTGACEVCHSGHHHVGEDCMGCHEHGNGFVASCAGCHGNPPATNAHLKHAGTGAGEYAYDCALCHPVDHDGTAADITFSGLAATWAGASYSAAQKQCSNLYCHGSATADWDAGTGGACGDCHGAAGTGRPDGVGEPSGGSHLTASHQVACVNCHTHDGTDTTQHVNGPANANGDALVSAAGTSVDSYSYAGSSHASSPDPDGYKYTGGTCANTCHGNQLWGGTMSCTSCHTGSGGGAKDVGPTSTHLKIIVGGVNQDCSACHPLHSGGVLVLNKPEVGISYTAGGRTGFWLGGSATTGLTEAEICWNCHDQNNDGDLADAGDVSEWGANNQTATGNSTYSYGSLNQKNWVGASWSSANFSYKTGTIRSTHAVDGTAAVPGVDPVENIRCSYCHDVHELARAAGDAKVGKPYLRGTWKGNPYKEDGAPLTTSAYTPRHWGAVPRGSILNNEYGGFQIDQNNSYPTAGGTAPTWNAATSTWIWPAGLWTVGNSAGLCTLCHGSDVDILNTFGNATDAWIGSNGHSNSAIGGTGSAAANIFRTSQRAPSGVDTQGAKPDMGYRNHGAGVGYGFRGTDGRAFDILNPTMDGQLEATTSRPYGGNHFQWGVQVNDTTTEKKYHQFSCSKCHNPHASRLPRLMITNCLDTKHNTWDDPRAGINAVDQARTNNNGITLSATSTPDNWGRTWSNTTSAQNCHRLAGDNRGTPVAGFGSGWNKVTPW